MCKASIFAPYTREAKYEDVLILKPTREGFPYFCRKLEISGLITCITHGRVLAFKNVPRNIQEKFGIGQEFTAMFVDEGDNVPDQIRPFESHIDDLDLYHFLPDNSGCDNDMVIVVGISLCIEQDKATDVVKELVFA